MGSVLRVLVLLLLGVWLAAALLDMGLRLCGCRSLDRLLGIPRWVLWVPFFLVCALYLYAALLLAWGMWLDQR